MPSFRAPGIADRIFQAERPTPSGVTIIGQNFPIDEAPGVLTPSTGMLYLSALFIEKGEPLTGLVFKTGTTAAVGTTNWWYGLWSHDTAAVPHISSIVAQTVSGARTSGSPTITGSGYTGSLKGRLVTGSGIPASSRIVEVTSTTLTLSANATSGTATATTLTIGQYAGPRQNIAATADTTTTVVPAADTFYPKAFTIPWVAPASGLYFAGWMHANSAGTQPNLVGRAAATTIGTSTFSHLAHSNAGPHSTPPGAANPIASVTNVVNRPWVGFY